MSGAVTQVPPPSPTLPEAKTNLNVKAIAHPNCLTPLHLSLSLSSVTVTCTNTSTSTGTDAGKGKSASDSEPSIGIPGPSVHNFDSESKSRVGTSSTKAIAIGSSFFSDPEDETDQGEHEHEENSDMDMDSDLDMDLIAVAAGFDLPVSVSSRTPTPLKTPIDTPTNNTSRSPSCEQAPSLAGVGTDDTRVGRGSYAQVYGFRSLPRSFVHLPSPVPHPSRSLHVHQEASVPRGATPAILGLGSAMGKGKSQSLISSGDSLPSACARSLPPRLSSAEKSPKTPTPSRPPRSYPPHSTPATNKIPTPTSTSPLALSLSTPGKRPKKSRMSGVISHFTLDSSTSSWAAASLSNTRNDPHIISTSLSNDFVVDPFAKDDGTTMHITTGTRIKPSPSISADTSSPTSSSFNSRGPDPLLEHERSSTLKKKHRSVGLDLGSLRPPLPRPRRLSTPPPPPSSKGHGWHEKKQNQLYAVYPLMQHL
ncbi:hypothetical protein BT96DRAFT_499835 [Gymnopus androsaceus JB14]|uniref:Uncharacterized protein n=1 Tax=Gymnopus androsaceus JB14 TaxID=1447944 RepID=A0A6A4I375_9AGAR|nr:hypothetical protein BT96DRAFT_499835 [Gymnopus androsaceus JB14]